MQKAIEREKDKIEREVQLAILEEALRLLRQKDKKLQEKIRSRSHLKSSKTPTFITHYEDDNRKMVDDKCPSLGHR